MLNLEQLWRDAPAEHLVCTATGATKNMVLTAIMDGAHDFEAVRKAVPLCPNNECAKVNPSKRGCRENVETLLSIYVPIYELMFEGGGCKHDHKPRVTLPPASDCGNKSTSCDETLCSQCEHFKSH